MSSVNPNNIDGTYPIAGQDNDSQGFRDNFTNIKNNFTFTATELTDLQNNAILKSALSGTTLNNNLNNAQLIAAQISKFTETRNDLGTTSSAVTVSWSDAHFQTLAITGNTTVTLSNWPTSGFWTYLVLDVTPSTENLRLILPSSVSVNASNIQGFSGNAITLPTGNVSYRFEFSTYNGGTTVAIRDLYRNYDAPIDFTNLVVSGSGAIAGNLIAGLSRFAAINSTPIGNATASTGAFSTLSATGNVIGGLAQFASINSTPIGNATASTGAFTTLTATGAKIESGYQFYQPSANVFIQANVNVSRVILAPFGNALVSFSANITLPNVQVVAGGYGDGTLINISSNSAVQFFSVMAPDSTQSITPQGNVALAAGDKAEYLYRSADNTWYKVG
jgi:hypothetical protein